MKLHRFFYDPLCILLLPVFVLAGTGNDPDRDIASSPYPTGVILKVDPDGSVSGFPGSLIAVRYTESISSPETISTIGALGFCEADGPALHSSENPVTLNNGTTVQSWGPESFGLEKLEILQSWTPHVNHKAMDLLLIPHDTVHVRNEIDLYFNSNSLEKITFLNAAGAVDSARAPYSSEVRASVQMGAILHTPQIQYVVMLNNPYQGNLYWHQGQGLRIRLLRTITPANSLYHSSLVHSVLIPGDTLRYTFRLMTYEDEESVTKLDKIRLAPSPHPGTVSSVILFTGDDLPFEHFWEPWTTPVYDLSSFAGTMVRLMEDHPYLKLNIAMILDPLGYIQPMKADKSDGWESGSGIVAFIPFDSYEGERCLRIEGEPGQHVRMKQTIRPEMDGFATLSGMVRVPPTPSGAAELRVGFKDDSDKWIESIELSPNTDSWSPFSLSPSFQMHRGEDYSLAIDLVVDSVDASEQDPYVIRQTQAGFFDAITLNLQGSDLNLVRNGGFETGESAFTYEDNSYDYWKLHGNFRRATAPEEFLEFFHRVERKEVVYGWEDRVNFVMHGYHHTSPGFNNILVEHSVLPPKEFTYGVKEWATKTFDAIDRDLALLGMTTPNKAMRPSGFDYQQSTIQMAIQRGYRWIDAGLDELAGQFWPVYGAGGHLFLHRNQLWGDTFDGGYFGTLKWTRREMKMGGISNWGMHPGTAVGFWGQDQGRYQNLSDTISAAKREFPNVIWDFQQALMKREQQAEQWETLEQELVDETTVKYSWKGGFEDSTSLVVFHGKNYPYRLSVKLDGDEIPFVREDDRSVIILPELEDTYHSLTIHIIDDTPHKRPDTPTAWRLDPRVWPQPTNGTVTIGWDLPANASGRWDLELVNMLGQRMKMEQVWPVGSRMQHSMDLSGFSSGLYFVRIRSHDPLAPGEAMRRVMLVK